MKIMVKYLLSICLSSQLALAQKTIPFSIVKSETAIYKLFSAYISKVWKDHDYGQLGQTNYLNLIDLKLYELNVSCENRPLIAFPFEGVRATAVNKLAAKDHSWINKNGSRLQVYAIDYALKDFTLIYDGELVDFLGADSQSNCPNLIGTKLIDSRIKRIKIIYSLKEKKYF